MTTNLQNLFYTEGERTAAAQHDPALSVADVDLSVAEIDEEFEKKILHLQDEISLLMSYHEEICAKIHIRPYEEKNRTIAARFRRRIRALNGLQKTTDKILVTTHEHEHEHEHETIAEKKDEAYDHLKTRV